MPFANRFTLDRTGIGRRLWPVLAAALLMALPNCRQAPPAPPPPSLTPSSSGPATLAPPTVESATAAPALGAPALGGPSLGAPTGQATGPATGPSPQATVTLPGQTVVEAQPTPTEVCRFAYFFAPPPVSCPLDAPVLTSAAEQPFENGFMVWLDAFDAIYVFYWDGRWQRAEDTWAEGQPEQDPAIVPPADRYQPIRGFGKLWRERPLIRQELGWALGPELGFEAAVQESMPVIGSPPILYLRVFNGQVLALTARDQNGGDWVIAAS